MYGPFAICVNKRRFDSLFNRTALVKHYSICSYAEKEGPCHAVPLIPHLCKVANRYKWIP